jgi:Fe-S-cluster containining protein
VREVAFEIQAGDRLLSGTVSVATEPIHRVDLLHVIQGLSDVLVKGAAEGVPVTCSKGCSACCYQIVPVSEVEAIHLANLISGMRPDRRAAVEARFAGAAAKLKAAGLFDDLSNGTETPRERRREAAYAYFSLGIPCPFLEDRACSIYEHRPLRCREFLAVSSPAFCDTAGDDRIETLALPLKLSNALFRFGGKVKMIPLSLLLEHPLEHEQAIPGPELFENFLQAVKEPTDSAPSHTTER